MSFEYKVVTLTELGTFSQVISQALNADWKLAGGVSTFCMGGSVYYSQALYKELDTIKPQTQVRKK